MSWPIQTIWCENCGVEIGVGGLTIQGKHYCCQDCLEGRPCQCGERMEMEEPQPKNASLIPS